MELTLWSDKSSLPDTTKQMDNQLQSQDTGNHAEAATWSVHTGPWTYTGGIAPNTIFPQSPFVHPPTLHLGESTHKQFSVLWWTMDSVELEAKGQASAQITTGTVILKDQKK